MAQEAPSSEALHPPGHATATSDRPSQAAEDSNAVEASLPTAAEGSVQTHGELSGYRLYAVAVGVLFGSLMMSMDISVIGTVRPGLKLI